MKIAEGLLMRKQLEAKIKQLEPLRLQGEKGMFETKTERRSVSDNVDEVNTTIPKITLKEITKEYDQYATQLRKLDAALQKANWNYELDFSEEELKGEKKETPIED